MLNFMLGMFLHNNKVVFQLNVNFKYNHCSPLMKYLYLLKITL